MTTRRTNRGAFTLLEAMAASVVLAVGVVAVVQSLTGGLSASARIDARTEAHYVAAGMLDRAAAGDTAGLSEGREVLHGGVKYYCRIERVALDNALERVVCTVEWTCQGRARAIELERLVSTVREQ